MTKREQALVPGLAACVQQLAPRHHELCPRQVLGARLGLYAGMLLGVEAPQHDKRLLTIVETDGCFADGVEVATGCRVGARTLQVIDYGKIAATVVDTESGRALRLVPRADARVAALAYASAAPSRWHAQRAGYSVMPAERLFQVSPVVLVTPLAALLGDENARVCCARCGEEVIDHRELMVDGRPVCRACAGQPYYLTPVPTLPSPG